MKQARNVFLIISAILAITAWGVILTPLYAFAIYPAGVALLAALIALIIVRKDNKLKPIPISLIVIAAFAAGMALFLNYTLENKVAKDQTIDKVLETEKEEVSDDLDDALKELE